MNTPKAREEAVRLVRAAELAPDHDAGKRGNRGDDEHRARGERAARQRAESA
jgi:hypothetical protein